MSDMRSRIVLGIFLAAATAACSTDPQAAKAAYSASGDAYAAQQKYSEAIIEYRNAVQKDPRDGDVHVKLAETYLKAGDNTGAYGEYLRAADLLPERPDVS